MRRVILGAVATLLLALPTVVVATGSQAAVRARASVVVMTAACVDRDDRDVRWSATGACGAGRIAVDVLVSDRLRVCVLRSHRVRQLGRRACTRQDGTSLLLPDNVARHFCADTRRAGLLRAVSRPAACLSRERAVRVHNRPPDDLTLSAHTVAEDAPIDTVVGTVVVSDPNVGDRHRLALVSGPGDTDNATFAVVDGELRTAGPLDHELRPSLEVRIRATDLLGRSRTERFPISVLDVNEAPTAVSLSPSSVPEEEPAGAEVGLLTAEDPDAGDVHSFSLVTGEGAPDANLLFEVDSGNLVTAAPLDHEESGGSLTILVRAEDAAGATHDQALTVEVLDVNEAPTAVSLSPSSVPEEEPAGAEVGLLTAADPDTGDSHEFALVPGDGDGGNGAFAVVGDRLVTAEPLDHETLATYPVRVRATDAGGEVTESELVVTVTDRNETPSGLELTPTSVAENEPAGTVVGTLTTEDTGTDSHSYALVAGTGDDDNHLFVITDDVLETAVPLDHEATPSLTVRVRSTDGGGASVEEQLVVTVLDVNEAPGSLALSGGSVDENAAPGSPVGTFTSADPDAGDTTTYALVAGPGDTDNAGFALDATTGLLTTTESFDFETAASLSVRVRVTDAGGLSDDGPFPITVHDVNDAPDPADDRLGGAIGNTQAQAGGFATTGPTVDLEGDLPLTNDVDQDGDALEVVPAVGVPTTEGGTVDIAADGTFRYLPGPGDRSLADSFAYTVTDGDLTSTATVSVDVGSRLVWYVDDDATGGTPDGRSTTPFPDLAALQGVGDPDGAGDEIFVYAGTYATGLPLETGQVLTGEAVGLEPGLVPPGLRPTISVTSTGSAVSLADGSVVDGLDIAQSGSGPAVSAAGVPTAELGATVSVSGGGGDAVTVTGAATGDITVRGDVDAGTGRAVRVQGRAGGGVAFLGPVTTTGVGSHGGVLLDGNAGAAVSFTGGLVLDTGAEPGFVASGGGTVTVTGSANSVTTTSGRAVSVTGVAIGPAGLTFRSVSADGAPVGIDLQGTGTAGGLTVTGSSAGSCGSGVTADCTGGTIRGTTGPGIRLVDTHAPSFTRLRVADTGDDGVRATGVSGGLTVAHSLLDSSGDAAGENGLDLGDSVAALPQGVTGTVAVTSSTVRDSADSNVFLGNSTGSAALAVTGSSISGAGAAGTTQDGVLVRAVGTAVVDAAVTGSILVGNRGDHVQLSAAGNGSLTAATVRGNTLTGGTSGASGQGIVVSAGGASWNGIVRFDVDDNVITGARDSAVTISGSNAASGSTFTGHVRDNTIGSTGQPLSCSATAHGIHLTNQSGAGTLVAAVSGNQVRRCSDLGISLEAGDGAAALHATVSGNTVSEMADSDVPGGTPRNGIHANVGLTAGDTGTSCLDARDNAVEAGDFGGVAPAGGDGDIHVRHRYATLRLPGYAGGATDASAVATFLDGLNPLTGSVTATVPVSGSYTGGAPCTLPPS